MPDVVPGGGYKIALINMHDTSDVLASSSPFSVGSSAIVSTPIPKSAPSESASQSHVSSPLSGKSVSVTPTVSNTHSGTVAHSASSGSAAHISASASGATSTAPIASLSTVSLPTFSAAATPATPASVTTSRLSSVPVGAPSASTSARTGAASVLDVPVGVALRELTFWLAKVACARAEWLVSGVGVDLAVITSPRPAFRLASHFVGLARHFAQSGLRSPYVT
ncbi:hypothetical protein DFH07DRAFT_1056724 [Mycena maculata]|uniref:Uncharacterized protein n=1 Tax=Mycena maculata TaxID=230809 RepID=A0AAD7NUS7_9AGAR|nr:hypothetical protein DFH07DRAFT_1056724 [Mycena maculata]